MLGLYCMSPYGFEVKKMKFWRACFINVGLNTSHFHRLIDSIYFLVFCQLSSLGCTSVDLKMFKCGAGKVGERRNKQIQQESMKLVIQFLPFMWLVTGVEPDRKVGHPII